MLRLVKSVKTPVKSPNQNYLNIIVVVVVGCAGGGVAQRDGDQTQGEHEELHCYDCCGRQMPSFLYLQPFI